MSFLAAFIYRQFIHYPPKPTASFKGQTVIVTGASSGLGLEACRSMVLLGAAQVIIACRNVGKGKRAATKIQSTTSCSPSALQVWELDLSSYTSVKEFSERAKKELPRLDAVIANAGIWTTKFRITEVDEETITTNVVSMCLLAFLLQPKLSETAHKFNTKTHFTVTGSELYESAKFKERDVPKGQLFATLADKDKSVMSDRYNVSKLLAIFVVKQLASLSPASSSGVIINCVGPGFCQSELGRDYDNFVVRALTKIFARPTEVGARTLVYGASARSESHGQYLPDCKMKETVGLTKGKAGAELQEKVWLELRLKLEAIQEGITTLPGV
ncbi:short-chain dehydrogenase protein [Rutstroemia sp. NJR-2017a WRK4]|nr:short-chain dehydrogenase protein [Rutstroemia sp. NJR-2017a WRK4]